MSRPVRILLRIAAGLAALLLIVGVAGIVILQSDWFKNRVRERIVTEVERASGGRVEIGSFNYDWKSLTAEVRPFVLHGTEGAGQDPLFQAASIQVGLKIISALKRDVDIASLVVDRPRVNVIVDANGNTNVPKPKIAAKSDKDTVETLLDLKIKEFLVRNGDIRYADKKIPLTAQGRDLNARLTYDFTGPRYKGDISFGGVKVETNQTEPLFLNAKMTVAIEQNKLQIASAHIGLQDSAIDLSGSLVDFKNPKASVNLKGRLLLAQLAPQLKLPPSQGEVALEGQASYNGTDGATLHAVAHGSNVDVKSGTSVVKGNVDLETQARYLENGQYTLQTKLDGKDVYAKASGTEFHGRLDLQAEAKGKGSDYDVNGRIAGNDITVREPGLDARNIQVNSAFHLDPRELQLNGLNLSALGGQFSGNVRAALTGRRDFQATGDLRNFSFQELARIENLKGVPYGGTVSGPVTLSGSLPHGSLSGLVAQARLNITPSGSGVPVHGTIDLNYDQASQQIRLANSNLSLPNSRLNVSGALGQTLTINLQTRNLEDLQPAVELATGKPLGPLPVTLQGGSIVLNATVQGALKNPQINGTLAADRFAVEGRPVDALNAAFQANRNLVSVSQLQVRQATAVLNAQGSAGLKDWSLPDDSAIRASAQLQNAELANLLKQANVPQQASGIVSANASVEGTVANPQAAATVSVDKPAVQGEQFDRLGFNLRYDGGQVDLAQGQVTLGQAHVDFNANYKHPPKDFQNGRVVFHANSTGLNLSQFRTVQNYRQGIEGNLGLTADGDADVRKGEFLLTRLDGEIGLQNLALDRRPLGALTVNARTNGQLLTVGTAGELRGSEIKGHSEVRLEGDYPGSGQLEVSPVVISRFRDIMALAGQNQDLLFNATVQGKLNFNGPLRKPEQLNARLELPTLEVRPVRRIRANLPNVPVQDLTLRNAQPVIFVVRGRTLEVQSAQFTGVDTNLSVKGTLSLDEKTPWDLNVNGNLNLAVLQTFDPDILAAGDSTLTAVIRGTSKNPIVDGRLDLKNAALNLADIPNGVENANGTIRFDRNRATIQTLTAQTGGGQVRLGGYVQFGGAEMVYRLQGTANEVRVRQEGVSITVDSNLSLTGTTSRSILSGLVTVRRAGFNQGTDVGGLLASSAKPVPNSPSNNEFIRNMQIDVRVESVPNLLFTTSLTSNVQAEVDLRVKGNPDKPTVLGRVTVDQGEINFFGTKYTINRGEIGFFNPVKIEPVLDLDLETVARGITVTINFSGPITKLNVSYRSDPPLESSQIIALLTVGRDPGANPALASSQTVQQGSLFQTGANTLIGQAVAAPVSNRLQRFFGVSKLKIDPQLTGVDNTPQARLTLEQQVSQNITMTFITNLTRSQQQIVRLQYDVNKNFSIVALRDENGIFGIDFLYKKALR